MEHFKVNTFDPQLFHIEDVVGDGACLFRAIANNLFYQYTLKDFKVDDKKQLKKELRNYYCNSKVDLKNDFKSDFKEDDFNWNIGWGIVIQSNLGPARIDFAFKKGTGERIIQVSLLNMF